MRKPWKPSILYGLVAILLAISIICSASLARLYVAGIPQKDVEQDLKSFFDVTIPVSLLCGFIFFLARISVTGKSVGKLLVHVVCIALPAVFAAVFLDAMPRESQPINSVRFLLILIVATLSYIAVQYVQKYQSPSESRGEDGP